MKVHKASVERQWPTVSFKFPGVEISFADEDEKGDAELVIEGNALPETLIHAMGLTPVQVTRIKPGRAAVADDFIDHGRERKVPPAPVAEEDDIVGAGAEGEVVEVEEAPKPKRAPAKKSASKKKE